MFFVFAFDERDDFGKGLDSLAGQYDTVKAARSDLPRIQESGRAGRFTIDRAQIATIEDGKLVLVEEFIGGTWYPGSQSPFLKHRRFGALPAATRAYA